MLRSYLLSILAFQALHAHAFSFELTCDADKNLSAYAVRPHAEDHLLCPAYESRGMKCLDTATDQSEIWIQLDTPMESHYSNRRARYKTERLKEVIRYALAVQADPYVALAVVAVENPLDGSARSEAYRKSWGNPPVDGSGAFGALGCQRRKFENSTVIVNASTDWPEIQLSSEGERRLYRMGNSHTSTFTSAEVETVPENPGCYFWIRGITPEIDWAYKQDSSNQKANAIYDTFYNEVRGQLGGLYLRKKLDTIYNLIQSGRGVWSETETWKTFGSSPYYQLAMIAQGFNGHGTYGAGELVNACLHGLNTAKNPIYGAGVMDLALNMFMGNSQVRTLVQKTAQELGMPSTPSVMCKVLGPGIHALSPRAFAIIQARIMRAPERAAQCPKYSYDFSDAKSSWRTRWNKTLGFMLRDRF